MRIRHALMFVLPSICLTLSCKKDKDPNWIKIGTIPITRWAGQDTLVNIPEFSSFFTATSDKEEIAKVTLKENGILITTSLPGSTTIRISDGQGHSAALQVHAAIINGNWYRRDDDPLFKPQMTVVADDAAFSDVLKAQVLADISKPQGDKWGMIFRADVLVFREMRGTAIFREGTYSFRDLTLKLTANGKEEVYKMKPISLQLIGLEQDLTADYKLLHPGKAITKVVVTRYFNLQVNPG